MNRISNKKSNKLSAITVSDIFMVIIVIGAIATAFFPKIISMDDESQIKAKLQEAYTYIANKDSVIEAAQTAPDKKIDESIHDFFSALNMHVPVDGFVSTKDYPVESSDRLKDSDIKGGLQWGADEEENQFGDMDDLVVDLEGPKAGVWSPWIASENTAYAFIAPKGRLCEKMSVINNQYVDAKGAVENSCFVIAVDVNGLQKGPNKLEPQQITGINTAEKLKKLSGDRFYIFVGRDGVATGSSDLTITGRIVVRGEVKLD